MFKALSSVKKNWSKVSYSQCGEDLIIKFIFEQVGINRPTYLDIGAHHPFYLSNTALFHKMGSRGINIEPDPNLFKEFLKHRKQDINLNIGVSDKPGNADFYIISTSTLNTFSKESAESYYKEGDYRITDVISLPVSTLPDVVNDYCKGACPQFLNVDAEGFDDVIIESFNTLDTLPLVICIETISFSNSGQGLKNAAIIDFIKNKGYVIYADTYINTIFVKEGLLQKQK